MNLSGWLRANQQLVAKSLQELSYEQVLFPEEISPGSYRLRLHSGVVYTFDAWKGLWTDLKVRRASLRRNDQAVESAGQFFIDCQKETGMDDIILGNFLEEMHGSLYADVNIQERSDRHLVRELITWSGEKIQTVLSGHPKILLSKGRLGWSAEDQDQFGPENEKPVQLRWLAARKEKTLASFASSAASSEDLLEQSFSPSERERLAASLAAKDIKLADFHLIPLHPWQWDRYVKIQFAEDLHRQDLVDLGVFGDYYLPQISLRTFSNVSRPEKWDIKLPMTILNTSAIRGIPAKYIPHGPRLSEDLRNLCLKDAFLNRSQTLVLEEKAGVSYHHGIFSQVAAAPYRYHELLGALWRQSAASFLTSDEQAIIAGSLFHQDREGQSLLGAYVKASGLSLEEWLRRYFKVVVLPLYHLQLHHGIGLVAHGQNVVLRLKNHVPVGLLLKDFQGDLRLTTDSQALPHDLTRLPPHYLIHDLITGHFVTVLRYVSETLQNCDQFAEEQFYALLGEVVSEYLNEHASELRGQPQFAGVDLLAPRFARVLVNRVRFKIGYADSAERPLPILGDELQNPLFFSLQRSLSQEAPI